MKKMKSIFKTLLCLVLVFVLVSCSANKMSFDSNGDVVQSKPYDVVWNGFQTQKGEYEISEGIVKLIQNETDKSLDNYPSYDYYNFKETYTNFTYETIIKIDQTELDQTTLDGKFGIKISYDDNNYLTCFLVPKHETLKICLLGMSNGTWIELWAPPNADDFVMPEELDLTQNGVKLKIERNNGIVYLYYNDTLIHTEYNFIPDSKQALKVGVTSERVNLVTYSNIKIEEVPLKKIKLNTPEVSLSGNILKIDETDFAENYYLFIDDEHQKIKVKVGENNINTILKELKMTDGTYKLKVFASNSDGERYENSDYSLETNYVFSTSLEALSKPVLSIDGSSIRFDKNENAKNYTMRIYVKSAMELGIDKENYVLVDAFDFDYAGIGYELNKLSEKLLTDEIYVFEVKANGDGTTYIDSDYSKRLEYQNKNAIFHEVKGSYIGSSNSLSLIKQETLDGDNYASTNRYDAAYFKTKYVNFSLSTLISNSDTTENVSEKYGITIAIDLNTYYDIFVVGNKIIALSQSGGTWVALWQTLYTIPDFERGNDVTLKVERKQDIITVYVNDILASTISNFTIGVDTEVNVGFTSEAISLIDYKNIEISELEDKKNLLDTPIISLKDGILSVNKVENAESYSLYINESNNNVSVIFGDNNLSELFEELGLPSGSYLLKVKATVSVSDSFEDSLYTDEISFDYFKEAVALTKPVISITDGKLIFAKTANATKYVLSYCIKSSTLMGEASENFVEVGKKEIEYTEGGYDLSSIISSLSVDEKYYFYLVAKGDNVNYLDSEKSDGILFESSLPTYTSVKGNHIGSSNSLSLIKQETLDGDNYGSTNRYDAAYFKTKYVNFSLSTLISNSDTTENISEKYGISIAIDLNTYYDIFVVGNKIIALSQSGGTWVALWQTLYTIPDFERGNDVTLKVERKQDIITVYVNDILASTISNFTLGVDTEVNVGFTSEAISSIDYKNIEISELSK